MSERTPRRNWSKQETLSFLHAYAARKAEFSDARKKKYAMANVLEDLISQGILAEPTTVEMLQVKLKNLLRAFKASKDNSNRTGAAPCIAPFEEIMEEIFGDLPIISNSHTLHLSGQPTTALPINSINELRPELEFVDADFGGPSSLYSSTTDSETPTKKIKPSIRQKYFDKKLEMKRKFKGEKLAMLDELKRAKLAAIAENKGAKERRHREKMELLREVIQTTRESNS